MLLAVPGLLELAEVPAEAPASAGAAHGASGAAVPASGAAKICSVLVFSKVH